MRIPQSLWLLNINLPSYAAKLVEEALSEDAVAISVLSPPRTETASIEAIYDNEPDTSEMAVKLAILSATLGMPTPDFSVRAAPKLDWLKKVAEDFPPIKIGRWTVHGALHRVRVPNRLNALQIDATSAFGTGEHPTTQGCLLMLDKLLKAGFRPMSMADIGCGSGILAMAAMQVSRSHAVAVDLDLDSCQIARGNARKSGLERHMSVAWGRGYAVPAIAESAPYDLIMANIFANPLCQMAKDLKSNLASGGIAILSGLLTSQAKKVIAAHRLQGLALIKHLVIGEWSALAFKRQNRAL
jgi:ribosomal protein L11 methyltransferase